ncbi:hypothetical protein E1A91_D03G119800v1 [Gossypium mustelinum]|uniref:Uncharacterized protein n=1 Tax=Gossypium mustelinum TaxID=34275 RepID=A0A5D2VMI2_GOSMU|nr:hypothetical protein E1A91_D03G119800v1 [Gossypium mustelinum]
MLSLFVFSLYFDHFPTDRLQMGEVVSTIPTSNGPKSKCIKAKSLYYWFIVFIVLKVVSLGLLWFIMEKRLLFSLLLFSLLLLLDSSSAQMQVTQRGQMLLRICKKPWRLEIRRTLKN